MSFRIPERGDLPTVAHTNDMPELGDIFISVAKGCSGYSDELITPVNDERFAGDEIIFEQEDHCLCDVGCVSAAL